MEDFEVTTPSGHILTISAPDQETALAGARQWHDDNASLSGNATDFAKSTPTGIVQSISSMMSALGRSSPPGEISLPGDAFQQMQPGPTNNGPTVPNNTETQKYIENNVTGPLHQPQSPGGEWGQRFGQFLPYSVIPGPGGGFSKAASAIAGAFTSSGGAQLGTEIARDTPYQGAAELAGGMLGPYGFTKAAELGGKATGQVIGGMASGAGKDTLKNAFQTGVEGGDRAAAFTGNMRGTIQPEQMAYDAQGAVGNLYRARGANYEADASNILNKSQQVVGYDQIDKTLQDSARIGTFQGVSTNPSTDKTRTLIQRTVDYWKGLGQENPQFNTPAGMVGLKQRLGDIRDNLEKYSPQWKVADEAYQSVAGSIEAKVPAYAKMTKDYAQASNEAENLKKTFSLGENSTPDTMVRKLQSISRDGANTNYGARANLAKVLEANGAPNLTAAVAGQASNSWLPRGLARMTAEGAGIASVGAMLSPTALLASPLTSPRLTGEAAHFAGRAAGYFNMPQAFETLQSKQQAAKNLALLLAAKGNQ